MDDLIAKLVSQINSLELVQSNRNRRLRKLIIDQLASSFLTDDERALQYGFPNGCRVRESAKIIAPENLIVGEYCNFAENSIVDASGGLSIGSHTTIGVGVLVWSHSSHLVNLKLSNTVGSDLIVRKSTKIGSGCFISGPSTVLAGACIGDQCIIQPFSNIAGNVPARSIVSSQGIKAGVLTDERIDLMFRMSL